MAQINEMTPLFLVPVDGATLVDAMTQGGESEDYAEASGVARPTVLQGDLPVLEVVEDHAGWCLVAVCPILEDVGEMGAFLKGRDGAATISELEIASGHAEDFIEHMGALAAQRVKGKWRPIDETTRALWSSHLVDCNTQKLRSQAIAANDDALSAKAA